MFKRALAIREKTLGPEHPDVAGSLNILAVQAATIGSRLIAILALGSCSAALPPRIYFRKRS